MPDLLTPYFEPADWSRLLPVADRTIRRGVRYTDVELAALEEIFRRPGWQFVRVWCAVGRRLFFGREVGTWIPYSRTAKDQNHRCQVHNRPGVWAWGDDLWILAMWDGQPAAVHLALDDLNEFFLGSPGERLDVEEWARAETEHAHDLTRAELLEFAAR